jgi:hypothetical protein
LQFYFSLATIFFLSSMPGNQGERQPGQNPQFHHHKPVEFQVYEGKRNFPTWSVYATMTSYYETYDMLRNMASQPTGGRGAVRRAVLGTVEHWKIGKPTPHREAARILVQDFLTNAVRRVEWTPVYDTLRGERTEIGDVDQLTALTYELLTGADWKPIVAGAEYLTQADDMLRGFVEDQTLTWVATPEARAHTGSVGRFANTVLDIYFQAVDWQNVADGLKGK